MQRSHRSGGESLPGADGGERLGYAVTQLAAKRRLIARSNGSCIEIAVGAEGLQCRQRQKLLVYIAFGGEQVLNPSVPAALALKQARSENFAHRRNHATVWGDVQEQVRPVFHLVERFPQVRRKLAYWPQRRQDFPRAFQELLHFRRCG